MSSVLHFTKNWRKLKDLMGGNLILTLFFERISKLLIIYSNRNFIEKLFNNTIFLCTFSMNFYNGIVGSKDLGTPTYLISSPRPTPRSKKCPRTNGENPDLQIVRPKTVVSSIGHNHGREKCHVTPGRSTRGSRGRFQAL